MSRLNLQPGQVVLDVGCGIGGSAFYMVKVRSLDWISELYCRKCHFCGSMKLKMLNFLVSSALEDLKMIRTLLALKGRAAI